MAVFVSQSEKETIAFAEEYAKTLRAGDVVCLEGEMGAGKTAFAKGVARGLGILEEVTSPTYAYVNSYQNKAASSSGPSGRSTPSYSAA